MRIGGRGKKRKNRRNRRGKASSETIRLERSYWYVRTFNRISENITRDRDRSRCVEIRLLNKLLVRRGVTQRVPPLHATVVCKKGGGGQRLAPEATFGWREYRDWDRSK